nr:group II intron maturase-specific domain-containing protein [Bradyrhizobium sp. 162]
MVGNLFIPKSKLKDLRHKIKVRVKATPTSQALADLIDDLNPVITGWRNYYRYATWATRDFASLDWWLWERIGRWLHRKHPKTTWQELRRRFQATAPDSRWRWVDGPKSLRFFREGGSLHFPHRGIRIPNGWNDPGEKFRKGADRFWALFTPSWTREDHTRRKRRMESRLLGNLHARFGERGAETIRRKTDRRCAPTLPVVFRARDHRGLDGDLVPGIRAE